MKIDSGKTKLLMANWCLESSGLAKKSGLTEQTIRNAINGKRIKLSSIGRIAKALDVRVEDIIKSE